MTKKSLAEDYKAAQFGGHLSPGRHPALILVDFVMAYLNPASPLCAGVEGAVKSGERVLGAARQAGIPIIFTNVVYTGGGVDGGVFYHKVPALRSFDKGSPLGAFVPALQPRDNELVISKQYASAFFGTTLSSTLTALNVDTLIVTGLSTSGCVRATALDACQHGFVPLVVREAVGDRDPGPHEASLFDLQAKYAEVVSEKFIATYLAEKLS